MSKSELKIRLDKRLVDIGLAKDTVKAQAMILAGVVEVENLPNPKPGDKINPSVKIKLKFVNPYVSRGGLKLESAMKQFNISCANKVCMDIGASTGGFTDYMLQHGAAKVIAVDVGHGLLDYNLVKNSKVVNMENVNFRYFSRQNLKENVEFVTIDVSFISLDKILPKAIEVLEPGGHIVSMVKPQFEASSEDLRGGVVKDAAARQVTIDRIKAFSAALGLEIIDEADSSVKGPSGNVEHFLLMRKPNADKVTKKLF